MGRTLYRELLHRRPVESWGNFTWLSLRTLLQSANDVVVKHLDTSIVNQRRMRWMAEQRARGVDVVSPLRLPDVRRLLLLGDPGEMDASQYVLVRDLAATDADALVLMSDIVYPAGNVNAWRDAVYLPYLGQPPELWQAAVDAAGGGVELPPWRVFATPGNHDWYDGLTGFMFHACGAEPLARDAFSSEGLSTSKRLAKSLWRQPARPDRATLEPLRRAAAARCAPGAGTDAMPRQPGPYFSLDVGGDDATGAALRLVCIDTGIDGSIDAEQALWLRDVLGGDLPKALVLGKPVVAGHTVEAFPIDRGPDAAAQSLNDVVREHGSRIVASIAGDIHNAQRIVLDGVLSADGDGAVLDVEEPAERTVAKWGLAPVHVVAGGGGAFLSATHEIPLTADGGLELPGVGTVPPDRHLRFPTREASVLHYARRLSRNAALLVAAHGLLLAAILAGLALVADGAAARLEVADVGPVDTWRVVAGGFAASGLLVLVPLAAAVLRRPRPLRGTRGPLVLIATGLVVAGFVASWDVEPGQAVLLAGAVGAIVGLPLALVAVPLLRAYPELRARVPTRTVAAGVAALLASSGGLADDSRLVVLAGAAIVVVVVVGAAVIARVKRKLNRAAIDGRLRAARTLAHIAGFWPLFAVAGAVALVPGDLGTDGVQDAAALIALIEALAAALVFSGVLLECGWTARAALPRPALAWVLAAAVAGAVLARVLPLDAGWAWELAMALPAGTLAAGLLMLTRTRTHAGQVALALQARDGHPAPGLERNVALFRAMAIAAFPSISEVSEATEPPFHKSFLTLDVRRPGAIVLELHGCDYEGGAFLLDRLTLRVGRPG